MHRDYTKPPGNGHASDVSVCPLKAMTMDGRGVGWDYRFSFLPVVRTSPWSNDRW